ncbi:MAG: hypothetical protein MUP11_04410, partial [Anaerolineales bacterium]|nr:hypothetical protein [Anaerolineales bacterium]
MNQYQFSVFIIPTILAGFLSILAVSMLWSHSSSRGSKALIYLFIAIAFWSFGYTLELVVPSLPWKAIWLKFEYLGIVWISVFWLLFCLRFSNAYTPKTKNFLLIFSWVPLITLTLAFTNEYHHLIWDNLTIVTQYG